MTAAALQSAPWEVLAFCLLLLVAPALMSGHRQPPWQLVALGAAVIVSVFAETPGPAYAAVAAAAVLHAIIVWPATRSGGTMLAASAVLACGVAAALAAQQLTLAFVLSCLAVAARAGVFPFHVGVAALCDRAPRVQTQQLASTIALVFVHLRFVDHHAEAIALAPVIVPFGALTALMAALATIVQRDLRGLYRGTTSMHGGMLLAALGAASLNNFAAALLVAVAMALAVGGLGLMVMTLEDRVGAVGFSASGGHLRSFPRLAALFAFFGGAGVGLPGTAGFVADDLLLHTLWLVSPPSAVVVILSSALLAVATLMAYSRVFLGPARPSLAPDIGRGERVVGAALVLLLLLLGFVPGALLNPADAFLTVSDPATTARR